MLPEKTINALRWITDILNNKNIQYQVSGGLAAKIYGSQRELNDIDIEIPEEGFDDIAEDIKPFIADELKHHKNGKWDSLCLSLNYEGQEIDISGAYTCKVSNQERTGWIDVPADFSKIEKIKIGEMEVNVIGPQNLIDYKQHLDGDHQLEDIEAAKKYIAEK